MKRSGHYRNLPANALPPILWNLLQAWLGTPAKRKRTRRRREQDVRLLERPA